MRKKITLLGLAIALLLTPAIGQTNVAHAATPATYGGERTLVSPAPTTLMQGEPLTYRVGFKNTGKATWKNTGSSSVTIKTTEAIKYEHWFTSDKWLNRLTVTTLTPAIVKPGEVGFFNLPLEAPKRAAKFTMYFAAFAGTEKISGTEFTITVTVTGEKFIPGKSKPSPITPTPAPVPQPATNGTSTSAGGALPTNAYLKATVLLRSAQSLSLAAGESTTFTIGYKNTGERNWRNTAPSLTQLFFDPASTSAVSFRDASWSSDTLIAPQSAALVNAGEISFITFKLTAPQTGGQYQPEFYLAMGNTLVDGSRFRIPIGVAAPAPVTTPTATPGSPSNIICIATDDVQDPDVNGLGFCQPKHEEPLMRVGIDKLNGQLGVTADVDYIIEDNSGTSFVRVNAGMPTYLSYSPLDHTYVALGPGPVVHSPLPLRIRGADTAAIITLPTFKNPVAYNAGWNDNSYRGVIEIRWSEKDEKVWIINELPMEAYLKGLAESSNAAQSDYQKALIVAARSYALYHHETGTKHRARYFDVVASVGDQYYRGYESEKRLVKVGEAVAATRGQVVTYQGNVVVTPYSASTSGTTKAWEDVWGGTPKPWLIRKAVPWDATRQKFGHAVGLSQLAANDMAKDGWNYIDILKFFYVNTDIAQWYK